MLIAITGATGFLGHYVVNCLLADGHRCRCWFRPTSDRDGFDDPSRIDWVPGHLNDSNTTSALVQGADAVVHAAVHWGREGGVSAFADTNVVGSVRLMEQAKDAGAQRFVFIGTCAVHEVILDDRTLDEAHPLWPTGHYGACKAAVEKFVHSFGLGRGWGVCSLRPTGIYGLHRPAQRSKWFDLVAKVAAGEPIESAAGGKEVHAEDCAAAVSVLLQAPLEKIAGQAFNCYDHYVSEQAVARIAAKLTGSGSRIADLNKGCRYEIDTSKIQALGMKFGGRALLEKTVAQLVEAVA